MRDKKGVLGLPTVKAVFILFLIIAVIAVTIILTMTELRNVAETVDIITGTTSNESVLVSGLGSNLDPSTQERRNRQCTIVTVLNQTGEIITAANYTEANCIITNASHEYVLAAELWNVTYTWSYSAASADNIKTNLSSGVAEFFDNTSTIYSILIVVIIILAIAIIIAVVTRFGGGGSTRRESSSSSGESGTLMGV